MYTVSSRPPTAFSPPPLNLPPASVSYYIVKIRGKLESGLAVKTVSITADVSDTGGLRREIASRGLHPRDAGTKRRDGRFLDDNFLTTLPGKIVITGAENEKIREEINLLRRDGSNGTQSDMGHNEGVILRRAPVGGNL